MQLLRTIFGSAIGAILALTFYAILPFTPDLSDWGGRTFPRTYLWPLLILAIASYCFSWTGAKISGESGRLSGMLTSIIAGAVIIILNFNSDFLATLFHHPAYPVFSDHVLLALAVMLVAGHLGGLRYERSQMTHSDTDVKQV